MKKILLVEDEKLIARAYQLGLQDAGFDVDIASDGVVALEALKTCSYDLILLDLILPKMDGFEFMKQRIEQKLCPGSPLIVLSNLGQVSDIKKSRELGATDYLVKADYSLQDVVDRVTKALSL